MSEDFGRVDCLQGPLLREVERLEVEVLVVERELETVGKAGEELLADDLDGIAGEVELLKVNHVGEHWSVELSQLIVAQIDFLHMLQVLEGRTAQGFNLIVRQIDLLDGIVGWEEVSWQGLQFVSAQDELLELGWAIKCAVFDFLNVAVAQVNHLELSCSGEDISCDFHWVAAGVELRELFGDVDELGEGLGDLLWHVLVCDSLVVN